MEDKTKIAVKPVGSQYHLKRDTKLSVDSNDKLKLFSLKQQIKFIDSEKATKFCEISTVDLIVRAVFSFSNLGLFVVIAKL